MLFRSFSGRFTTFHRNIDTDFIDTGDRNITGEHCFCILIVVFHSCLLYTSQMQVLERPGAVALFRVILSDDVLILVVDVYLFVVVGVLAVSYTHLDVYKRQPSRLSQK